MQQQQPTLGYTAPPPPSLNGGLYTGAPFAEGAPWRNFPVAPDAGYYNFGSLREVASAPTSARYMMPGGGLRPGNNTPLLPSDFANSRIVNLNAICIPPGAFVPSTADPMEDNRGFRGMAYL